MNIQPYIYLSVYLYKIDDAVIPYKNVKDMANYNHIR